MSSSTLTGYFEKAKESESRSAPPPISSKSIQSHSVVSAHGNHGIASVSASADLQKSNKPERQSVKAFTQKMNIIPKASEPLAQEVIPAPPTFMQKCKQFSTTPYFWGSTSLLLCVILLYTVKPPFIYRKTDNHVEKPKIHHGIVWGVALGVSALVTGIPFLVPLMKK